MSITNIIEDVMIAGAYLTLAFLLIGTITLHVIMQNIQAIALLFLVILSFGVLAIAFTITIIIGIIVVAK